MLLLLRGARDTRAPRSLVLIGTKKAKLTTRVDPRASRPKLGFPAPGRPEGLTYTVGPRLQLCRQPMRKLPCTLRYFLPRTTLAAARDLMIKQISYLYPRVA
jgi:hypothetical protein